MAWDTWFFGALIGVVLQSLVPRLVARGGSSALTSSERIAVSLFSVLASIAVIVQPWSVANSAAWLALVPIAAALAVIDIRHKRLPDSLTMLAANVALIILAVDATMHGWHPWLRALEASLVLFAAYLILNLLSRGGLGMGDVKFALAIGTMSGYLGWSQTLQATLLAFVSGGLVAIWLLLVPRRARLAARCPLAHLW